MLISYDKDNNKSMNQKEELDQNKQNEKKQNTQFDESQMDILPDLMPVLGYTDDFVAITLALIKVQGYIDEEVERKSKNLLQKIFGKDII